MINSATKQSIFPRGDRWIASRSLSSGAHSRDPLARNDAESVSPPPRRSSLVSIVGEDFSAAIAAGGAIIAERRAFTGLRDGEEMPLICPTCQLAFDASSPA